MLIQKKIMWVILFLLTFIAFNVHGVQDQEASTEKIPDIFIPFDTQDTEYMIVVEKESQRLFVYEYKENFREIFQTKCSTGKKIGAKTLDGDSKTPEGIYFFIKEHKDEELSAIYGIKAFPTDYPNLMDSIAGRTGSAIWLHGTNKVLKPRDSNGCIVLENSDIEKVSKYITLNRTPIIITDKLSHEPFEQKAEIKTSIIKFVSAWKTSIESGTYHEYVNFYDSEFVPDISWWTEWSKTRKSIGEPEKKLVLDSKKLAVFKHRDMYVVLFDLYLQLSGKDRLAGTKKLFLAPNGENFKIIGENYQTFPGYDKNGKENPFIMASRSILGPEPLKPKPEPVITASYEETSAADPEIENMIDGWLNAWSSKDIKAYGSYYAEDFRSQGMDKESWLNYKDKLNGKYKYINVARQDLKTKQSLDNIIVSFVQKYKSNTFQSSGIKNLVLKNERGQWKIYRETMKKR